MKFKASNVCNWQIKEWSYGIEVNVETSAFDTNKILSNNHTCNDGVYHCYKNIINKYAYLDYSFFNNLFIFDREEKAELYIVSFAFIYFIILYFQQPQELYFIAFARLFIFFGHGDAVKKSFCV